MPTINRPAGAHESEAPRFHGFRGLRRFTRGYWQTHPDAEAPLREWYKAALKAVWQDIREVRLTYPHADGIQVSKDEVLTIFNIGGNKYRLIVRIRYDYQLINVRKVMTHAEYSKR